MFLDEEEAVEKIKDVLRISQWPDTIMSLIGRYMSDPNCYQNKMHAALISDPKWQVASYMEASDLLVKAHQLMEQASILEAEIMADASLSKLTPSDFNLRFDAAATLRAKGIELSQQARLEMQPMLNLSEKLSILVRQFEEINRKFNIVVDNEAQIKVLRQNGKNHEADELERTTRELHKLTIEMKNNFNKELMSDYQIIHRAYHYLYSTSNRDEIGILANKAIDAFEKTYDKNKEGLTHALMKAYYFINYAAAAREKVLRPTENPISADDYTNVKKKIAENFKFTPDEIQKLAHDYLHGHFEIPGLPKMRQQSPDKTMVFFQNYSDTLDVCIEHLSNLLALLQKDRVASDVTPLLEESLVGKVATAATYFSFFSAKKLDNPTVTSELIDGITKAIETIKEEQQKLNLAQRFKLSPH